MKMTAQRHNLAREQILKILAPEYPKPVDAVILRRCLANFEHPMDANKLAGYLAYLVERGCVVVEEKPYDITLVRITSTGLDVLDGRVDDCGIGLDG